MGKFYSYHVPGIVVPIILLTTSCEDQSKDQRPNIVFIQCDQLNKRALSCYGGPVPTPNIDRLAKNGVRFTDAICSCPSSTPSRGSVVTSLYPHASGIIVNINDTHNGINEEDITTDKILNQNGYLTHHYGKWHLESNGATREMNLSYYPDPYTFEVQYKEEFLGQFKEMQEEDSGDWMDFYGFPFPVELSETFKDMQPRLHEKWKGKAFADLAMKMGRLRVPGSQWHDEICVSKTLDLIDRYKDSDKPFAVTCSFIWPHDPNFVHSPYYDAFSTDDIKIADIQDSDPYFYKDWSRQMVDEFKEPGLKEFLRIYFAAVKFVDDSVGKICKKLEETGQLSNTVIIFSADHGDMMSSHGMIWKSTNSFYKEIVEIPLIVSYPAMLPSGKTNHAQVNVVDMMPTILDLAGVDIPEHVQGRSLIPLIFGNVAEEDFRVYNFSERIKDLETDRDITPLHDGAFMVQTSKWKYIKYPDGKEFLYDRITDPNETVNLALEAECSEVKSDLSKAISSWLNDTSWKGKEYTYN